MLSDNPGIADVKQVVQVVQGSLRLYRPCHLLETYLRSGDVLSESLFIVDLTETATDVGLGALDSQSAEPCKWKAIALEGYYCADILS